MQDERTHKAETTVAELEHRTEQTVLMLLTDERTLWSFDELRLETANSEDVEDAVDRLRGAGLAHRIEDFAFASRAALRAQRYES